MKSLHTFITPILLLCVSSSLYAQNSVDLASAIAKENYHSIVRLASQHKELEKDALDAMCSVYNIDASEYEEITSLYQESDTNSNLGKFLGSVKIKKEQSIRNSLIDMSLEEIVDYIHKYPQRVSAVQKYLDGILMKDIKNLSYLELNYVNTTMPNFNKKAIRSEIATRGAEKKVLLSANVGLFMKGEQGFTTQIQYELEKIIWSFFIEGHKQLTHAYSQIPMVPDDASAAANQYQRLVKICLSPSVLQKMLQKEVNKYCEQVNKARKDYALIAGIKEYPKMSYKVPLISLNSNVNYNALYRIGEARRDYLQSREGVSQGSGIVGMLVGGLWGFGVKAIGDWMSVSGLVDSEYGARKEYVENVYGALYSSFKKYAEYTSYQLESTLIRNEEQYEKCIKQ